jgi:C-3',4' desaturase CrtD
MYDYIVIGAGYGGLSVAALLQNRGYKVLILEAHKYIGGCAGYYKRKDFTFDVGATTFSGVLPEQPIGKLIQELELKTNLIKLDPGMVIYQNGKKITRYSNKEKWINEISQHYPNPNLKKFWDIIYKINSDNWDFINQNLFLPPRSFMDLIRLVNWKNIKKYKMIFYLLESVQSRLNQLGLNNREFTEFINEQLLITTQTDSKEAPLLSASMGLAYPSETYYPVGGMFKLAEEIQKKLIQKGGEIFFKQKVVRIIQEKDRYILYTNEGKEYYSKGVIANIPIWNLAEITEGRIQKYFKKDSENFSKAPGAFVLNLVIRKKVNLETAYYQIHSNVKIPFCDSNSIFVSFSLPEDRERCPDGYTLATISTHTSPQLWIDQNKEVYLQNKKILTEFILNLLVLNLDFIQREDIELVLAGTPKTYEFYTKRKNGFVGGIPHSIKKNLLTLPSSQTPFKNFYRVGDTVFPGQGIPAVIHSAFIVVNRILE